MTPVEAAGGNLQLLFQFSA
jgi:hypothetical protein